MSIPLSVRVGDRNISRRVDDLTFRKSIHGTSEIGFRLAESLTAEFPAFERVYVYDGTDADILAEGRIEDPGRTQDDNGQQWDMSAIGEVARASDRSVALIYVDQDLTKFERRGKVVPSSTAEVRDNPGQTDADAIVLQFNPGQPIDKSSFITMIYLPIHNTGQELGGFGYSWDAGMNAPGSHRLVVSVEGDTLTQASVRTHPFSSAGGSDSAQLTGGTYTGAQTLVLRHERTAAATTIRTEDRWGSFYDLYVVAKRLNKDGSENNTSADYLRGYVLAHEVVADLLGRVLTAYDGATAVIDTSATHQFDQLAWPDGITAEQILATLMETLPDYYWQVGPADPVSGKPTFAWRKWPTSPRYVISLRDDGVSLPGADAERYNRVTFRWVDKRGRVQTRTYNAGTTISGTFVPLVAELENAGPGGTRLVREPEIQDLADEEGSQANADKRAAEFLLAHGTPPVSGTLNVSGKVWDDDLGQFVQPWRIEPGHLVFVSELAETAEDYSTDGRNGKSVFRIVGMTYTVSENGASLELDAPPRTDEVVLAEQVSTRQRKR